MTTEEQKAVEEAAEKYNKAKRNHLSYSYVGAFIKGAEFLSDLRNLSEPKTKVGEPSEELVEKIHETLDECVGEMGFYKISKRIAALLQPDVNAELLDCVKRARFDCTDPKTWCIYNNAISNYEKQQ